MLPPISRSDRRRFLKSFAVYAATGSSLGAVEQNKWENIAPFFEPPEEWRGQYGDYRSPLVFKDGSKVETAADWARRRQEIRADWMRLMGPWPKLITNPVVRTIEETRRETFLQIKINFKCTPT
ncbi:MAG: hypothetical protein H8E24_09020, partial [Verrucomicrobia bacterium]|nr:hypothetical protein [Verrucomicrobiota bacterium]